MAAAERVRWMFERVVAALQNAGVPYAIAGGHAVAAWVTSVDAAAARHTNSVDVLVRRSDLHAVRRALEAAGFVYRHASGLDMFLDGPNASPRNGVHLVFAGEQVRAHEPAANPDIGETQIAGGEPAFRVLTLEALVRVKLTAWRDKDRTHLRDLIDVGLVDASWPAKIGGELGTRLQGLIDTPGG